MFNIWKHSMLSQVLKQDKSIPGRIKLRKSILKIHTTMHLSNLTSQRQTKR